MVRLLIDFLSFLSDYASLLVSIVVLCTVFILLSKSIKKHARVYYIIFGIPFVLIIIQFILMLGGATPFGLFTIPVIGDLMSANSQMAGFGFPLLIVIMYIGALNPKNPYVHRLMVIRKELSIIAGFPVLSHSLIRVTYTFPGALQYFTDHTGYMAENDWVKSDLGVGISNFGYVLGILMVVVFLVLWVTSFDSVHKKMGGKKWREVQKWAYVLYAMLFVHSVTLHVGWMINSGSDDSLYLTKEFIAIASTVIIFLSYLILRLKKAKAMNQSKLSKGNGLLVWPDRSLS